MKTYKKVVVEAVNAPSGSYAAGCPQHTPDPSGGAQGPGWSGSGARSSCRKCEITG